MKSIKIILSSVLLLWLNNQVLFGQTNPFPSIVASDIILGNDLGGQRFFIYSRSGNVFKADFLAIAPDNTNGEWDWGNGLSLKRNGWFGIGTLDPQSRLHVIGGTILNGLSIGGDPPGIDYPWEYETVGLSNTNYNLRLQSPNSIVLHTGDTHSERMIIQKNGFVGIGTINPQSELAVNGKITTKEIEVTLQGWPDQVFEENYELRPLQEVENYITEHKHLPEIPSKTEVLENGVNLGEMQGKLLQKIEELMLYVISLENRNNGLEQEISELREEIKNNKD